MNSTAPSLTFDTNCLFEIDEDRPQRKDVQKLLALHDRGLVNIALAASSASENQKGGQYLKSFADFKLRAGALGFHDVEVLKTIARYDVAFYDNALYAGEENVRREEKIAEILFPKWSIDWKEVAEEAGVELEDRSSKVYRKWRNRLLDVQAFWAHDHRKRDYFVTSDKNFRRLNDAPDFPNAIVVSPSETVARLEQIGIIK